MHTQQLLHIWNMTYNIKKAPFQAQILLPDISAKNRHIPIRCIKMLTIQPMLSKHKGNKLH